MPPPPMQQGWAGGPMPHGGAWMSGGQSQGRGRDYARGGSGGGGGGSNGRWGGYPPPVPPHGYVQSSVRYA